MVWILVAVVQAGMRKVLGLEGVWVSSPESFYGSTASRVLD